jgi:hypothetical protein
MARTVTLKEFNDWIKENIHRTWFRDPNNTNKTLEIKYLYPSIDTRTMEIFCVRTRKESVYGSHMDDHDTVLTALIARLDGKKVKTINPLDEKKS